MINSEHKLKNYFKVFIYHKWNIEGNDFAGSRMYSINDFNQNFFNSISIQNENLINDLLKLL